MESPELVERVLDDPVRGRRTMWVTQAGRPARLKLADGTQLTIEHDEAGGRLSIGTEGGPLLSLSSPVAIPALVRTLGLTPGEAAGIDGVHRLTATDRDGETSVELRERTLRVQRDDAVLRIDADDAGRPRRVTAPGFADLVYRWSNGAWTVGQLDGTVLLHIENTGNSTRFRAADSSWAEEVRSLRSRWWRGDGSAIVDTDLDLSGAVVGRNWHGGTRVSFGRDGTGRLSSWCANDAGGSVRHERRYVGGELSAEVDDGVRTVIRSDRGGRLRERIGPSGAVRYEYDANGRRTARVGPAEDTTSYRYDALGQLTEVRTRDTVVEYRWDALGRRISVTADGVTYLEHRDTSGRLWSVTTADGAPVVGFIWWDGRVVARRAATGGLDEVYLTVPYGTLLGVAGTATGWAFVDAGQPPFGAVARGVGWRPTLFGHIADDHTPLIPFGARELDPETGQFLTPDPWHGDADDPRRIAGQPVGSLPREIPADRIHPYALCHNDPLGGPDNDGHFGWGNLILTLFLGPTWGAALTSLSVFLFAPLNIYFEIVGLLGYFGGRHFWPQHSIFGLRFASGSARLGTAALALNGFVPRGFAGVSGDRCITIGHVVWESRHYFQMLDRARVLELDDVSGAPGADGKPSFGGSRFSDTAAGSIVTVKSTDTDRREWVHASWWTRGPGNGVGSRSAGGPLSFEDRTSAGGSHARGTMALATPMPRVMPMPQAAGDRATLEVTEYLCAGGKSSTAELIPDVWFAFEVSTGDNVAANTVLGITAGDLASAYGAVLSVVPGPQPVAVLDSELPDRYKTAANAADLRTKVSLRKLTAAAATSNGWALRAGSTDNKQLDLAAPGHPVAAGEVYKCHPTTADPAHPERTDAYAAVEKVKVSLTVSPTLGGADVHDKAMYRLTPKGSAASGNFDPAQPNQVTFTGDNPFAVDDLVQVTSGATTLFGRVESIAAAVPPGPPGAGGAPGTPGTPASITLDEPLTGMVAGRVAAAQLKETNRDTDKGEHIAQAADVLTVEVSSTALFAQNQPVLIDSSPRRVRNISAVGTVAVDLVDPVIGTGPYTLTKFEPSGGRISSKLSAARFVKHAGGDAPSTYRTWPASIMGVVPTVAAAGAQGYTRERQPNGWRFFLQANPAPAAMHSDFHDYWQPVTVAGANYWLLSGELKIVKEDNKYYWEPDAEDDHPRRHRQEITISGTGTFALTVQEFVPATPPVTRGGAGGGRVFAYPAEVQVPEEPQARWSLADSLADHELTHTLQNTYWGPLLGALPLQGVFRTVRDSLVAGGDHPDWMDYHPLAAAGASGFQDSNLFEILSIGGLMQIIWSFVILGPALPSADARNAILSTTFDQWSAVFNPLNQLILNQIPKVQPDAPATHDPAIVVGRALLRALDLKSWTPFMGFIKLLLPDGPRNFLEQHASRKSGDLYSTILTVNDKFNAKLAIAPDKTAADQTVQLGSAARLMSFYDGALSRNTGLDRCDAPGSPLTTFNDGFTWGQSADIVQFKPSANALLPADLYEAVGAPAPASLRVDGPTPTGGGAAPVTELLQVPSGTSMRPKLRAIVPVPPRVWRALGCYLIPAGTGVWSVEAPDAFAHDPAKDAHTAAATVTIASAVSIGSDDVPWAAPAATGASPAATGIRRYVTEKQTLGVTGQDTTKWEAQAGAGIRVDRHAGTGWDLTMERPGAGVALPTDVRIRIWSKVEPGDAKLFDLTHPDVPTLQNKRSYLDDALWIPVRDFIVTVEDLPPIPAPAPMKASDHFDLNLPIKLAGPANIVPAGDLVTATRTGDFAPRGETWRFTVASGKIIESRQVVHVVVRYDAGTERPFDLTIDPDLTLDGASTEARVGTPLTLTVNGGSAPYSVVDQPPANSRATVAIAGNTVTVTVAAAAAGTPAVAPIDWQLKVRDSTGKVGARTLTLRP